MTRRTVADLNRLVDHPEARPGPLPPAESKGPIPGRGLARPTDDERAYANPLTEQPLETVEIIKTINISGGGQVDIGQMVYARFLDGAGRSVEFVFKPTSRPLPVPPPA